LTALGPELRRFLDTEIVGVLATEGESGRPRQSVVYFARDGERLLITTLAGRHKVKDVERTGWASLCVLGHERPFPSVTLSGRAEILTEGIGPSTAAVTQRLMGLDAPPEPQSDEAPAGLDCHGRGVRVATLQLRSR
jgi:PPOX class probable F420-dependent enzyme